MARRDVYLLVLFLANISHYRVQRRQQHLYATTHQLEDGARKEDIRVLADIIAVRAQHERTKEKGDCHAAIC